MREISQPHNMRIQQIGAEAEARVVTSKESNAQGTVQTTEFWPYKPMAHA